MTALFIVLLGAGLVIALILGPRLHAFLALIGAALVVVSITPEDLRIRGSARTQAAEVSTIDGATGAVAFTKGTDRGLKIPGAYRVLEKAKQGLNEAPLCQLQAWPSPADPQHALCRSDRLLHPGDLLIADGEWAKTLKAAQQNPGEVVAQGFGDTTAHIGLIIALASVIGACLMESGAAERIVLAMRSLTGEKHTSLAFVPSGFLLCIPAFFEPVFYLLMPLGKALRQKTGRDYVLYILSVVAGATMAQSLVPPTPGPIFVAGALHVKIGTMMLAGTIVGLIAAAAGYAYALWANRRWNIPLRDVAAPEAAGEPEAPRALPPLGWSLLPIAIPIVLLVLESLVDQPGATGRLQQWVMLLGNKNMALAIGAVAGLLLLAQRKGWNWRGLAKPLNHALESAGTILLITPAGGAFGYALRNTDIAGIVSSWFSGDRTWLLPAAFGITMLVRLAQGSATVAMITGVGIIAPVAASLQLPYHPVYLALAIGCGSKPVSWMNDSGFWIISRTTGMTETETLKTVSVLMAVMGFTGLAATLLGAWLFPFA
jgi:gluconate:H+ symporter, GntP family